MVLAWVLRGFMDDMWAAVTQVVRSDDNVFVGQALEPPTTA